MIQRDDFFGGASGYIHPQGVETEPVRLSSYARNRFEFGAGKESRTPVSTLGRSHNSHYTIPALSNIIT